MKSRPILCSTPMVRALLEGRKTQARQLLRIPRGCSVENLAEYCPDGFSGRADDQESWGSNWADDGGPLNLLDFAREQLAPGDHLWVREKAAVRYTAWHITDGHSHQVSYAADQNEFGQYIGTHACGGGIRKGKAPSHFPRRSHRRDGQLQWCPSVNMPRWASRLTLSVTDVRVQRLHDITAADAIAEGIFFTDYGIHQPPGKASGDGGKTFHPLKPRQHNGWHWKTPAGPDDCLPFPESAYGNFWNHTHGAGSWSYNPWVIACTFAVHRANVEKMEAGD